MGEEKGEWVEGRGGVGSAVELKRGSRMEREWSGVEQ